MNTKSLNALSTFTPHKPTYFVLNKHDNIFNFHRMTSTGDGIVFDDSKLIPDPENDWLLYGDQVSSTITAMCRLAPISPN